MMLIVVFNDCDLGTGVQFRTDGNVLDVRRLQARTKVHTYVTSCLPTTALWLPMPFMRYSWYLIVSWTQLNVLAWQSVWRKRLISGVRQASQPLPLSRQVATSCHQSTSFATWSFLSNMVAVDVLLTTFRLTKAGSAFGKLHDRLWRVHSISLSTKIAVYVPSFSHLCYIVLRHGPYIGTRNLISFICDACVA